MATRFFNNVANLFRNTQQVSVANAPAPAPAPAAPHAAPTPQAPNAVEQMAELFNNPANRQPPADPLAGPILNTDNSKIAEAAGKIDFVGQLDPALVQKAMSGQEPAAFLEVMNAVGQRALATAAQLSAATIESGLQRHTQRIDQALPGRFKRMQLEGMAPENEVLATAGAAPMLAMLRNQVQQQNPHMSPAEINSRAENLLIGFSQQVAGSSQDPGFRPGGLPQNGQNQDSGTDWDKWAGLS